MFCWKTVPSFCSEFLRSTNCVTANCRFKQEFCRLDTGKKCFSSGSVRVFSRAPAQFVIKNNKFCLFKNETVCAGNLLTPRSLICPNVYFTSGFSTSDQQREQTQTWKRKGSKSNESGKVPDLLVADNVIVKEVQAQNAGWVNLCCDKHFAYFFYI